MLKMLFHFGKSVTYQLLESVFFWVELKVFFLFCSLAGAFGVLPDGDLLGETRDRKINNVI